MPDLPACTTNAARPGRGIKPAPGAAEPEVRPSRVKGGAPMELFPGRRLRGEQPVQPAPAGGGQEASVQVWLLAVQQA